jgi:predicted lysophospholipase L1 biosynthesis ABC-type transport system permease subunit
MDNTNQHLESLSEIKNLMERSTKFISLSGLSGIIAGITALIGAVFAYLRLDHYLGSVSLDYDTNRNVSVESINTLTLELIGIALVVLVVSLISGMILTIKETKKNEQSIWDKNSMLLLVNLLIPLGAGGIFSLILIYHNLFVLVAPITLIFYGLALVNCSKYTISEIRYLGILEIVLGLISAVFVGKGLFFWAIGFGVLHIVYGTVMHFKYNKNSHPTVG